MGKRKPSPYEGMTVNERLFVAGLLELFDRAALARDRDRMIGLLKQVESVDFPEAEAIATTDAVLANQRL